MAVGALPVRVPSFVFDITDIQINQMCGNCGSQAETILHVFHSCTVAQRLWCISHWPLDICRIPTASSTD